MTLRCSYASSPPRLAALTAAALLAACTNLPVGPASGGTSAAKGMTLVTWTRDGYLSTSADSAVFRIRSLGATHVVLLTTAYQNARTSTEIRADPERTPSRESLRHVAVLAQQLGMAVVLKPHIDVLDGSWRGTIRPDDPSRWFRSYRDFLLPLAELADSLGCTHLVIGTELGETLVHEDLWRNLISDSRRRFSGILTYGASWDEASLVPFWQDLDAVGIDFYAPLAVRSQPARIELLGAWQPWLDRLARLHRRSGRPILLAEIGYRSVDGAGLEPFAFRTTAPCDPTEQADLTWAALEALSDAEWLGGVFWWNWRADGAGGCSNTDYTPSGKPAEDELRNAWIR